MSYEIHPQYNKTFLFPPNLEDLVPQDHPVRFIREFVEALDLDEMGFKRRSNAVDGRPSYSPELLLSIWLYGYFFKVYSSRKLEKACMENIGLLWLTGMNYPDHNTIWRFFKQNKSVLNQVYKSSVRIASDMGLIGMILHAVDGTKIQANVSRTKALHRRDLLELLEKIDQSIDALMDDIEAHEKQSTEPSFKIPEDLAEQLKDKKNVKETIKEKLKKLKEAETDHLSETDPDARMMKTGRTIEFSYNGQAVVDEENGILVGIDVTTQASDSHVLNSMLDHVESNLNRVADETLADGGYLSGEELKTAIDKGREVLVSTNGIENSQQSTSASEFNIKYFTRHPSEDAYICPKGGKLTYRGPKNRKAKTYTVKGYRCVNFKECPNRNKCSSDPKGRTIEINPYREAIDHQLNKHDKPGMKSLYKRRMALIEKVFGEIKHNWGFKRWTFRTLGSIRAQWSLIGTVYNLRKMHKAWVG